MRDSASASRDLAATAGLMMLVVALAAAAVGAGVAWAWRAQHHAADPACDRSCRPHPARRPDRGPARRPCRRGRPAAAGDARDAGFAGGAGGHRAPTPTAWPPPARRSRRQQRPQPAHRGTGLSAGGDRGNDGAVGSTVKLNADNAPGQPAGAGRFGGGGEMRRVVRPGGGHDEGHPGVPRAGSPTSSPSSTASRSRPTSWRSTPRRSGTRQRAGPRLRGRRPERCARWRSARRGRARDQKSLIGTSVDRVEQGTALVDRAGTTMGEIVTAIRRVTDIMGEISAASPTSRAAAWARSARRSPDGSRPRSRTPALVERRPPPPSLKGQARALGRSGARVRVASAMCSVREAALRAPTVQDLDVARAAPPARWAASALARPRPRRARAQGEVSIKVTWPSRTSGLRSSSAYSPGCAVRTQPAPQERPRPPARRRPRRRSSRRSGAARSSLGRQRVGQGPWPRRAPPALPRCSGPGEGDLGLGEHGEAAVGSRRRRRHQAGGLLGAGGSEDLLAGRGGRVAVERKAPPGAMPRYWLRATISCPG